MGNIQAIPRGAAIAIDDMLDHCAQVKAIQEVFIAQEDDEWGAYFEHGLALKVRFSC